MKAEKIIRLRIQNSTFCRRIRVVQGDTGRIFRFILEDVTMDGSEQARVYAKKPDGTEVYNDCEVVSPNEVLMESDSGQIFAAIGVVQAEIQISKSGKTITTYTFEFDVEKSLTRAGAIQSSSEYGALETAIAKAEGFYNPTFSEAATRNNINSGESIPTLFGKVKKWFTDLNTLIKLVGSTDISGIGDGTVTDALSVINNNFKNNPTFSLSPYKDKTIVTFGDSVLAGWGWKEGTGIIQPLKEKYPDATWINKAESGANMAVTSSPAHTPIVNQITSYTGAADAIILNGGVNDKNNGLPIGSIETNYDASYNTSTFCGALESSLQYIMDRYPLAVKLYIIPHSFAKDNSYVDSIYSKAIEICDKWNMPYLDMRKYSQIAMTSKNKSKYTRNANSGVGDGVHPVESWYRTFYSPVIDQKLRNLGIGYTTAPVAPTVIAVTSVSLGKNTLSIKKGESAILTATVKPLNATNQSVKWSTSNSNVTVSNGEVTGKAVGTSVVTVTTDDGGYTAQCTVNVTENTVDPSESHTKLESLSVDGNCYFDTEILPDQNTNTEAKLYVKSGTTYICGAMDDKYKYGYTTTDNFYAVRGSVSSAAKNTAFWEDAWTIKQNGATATFGNDSVTLDNAGNFTLTSPYYIGCMSKNGEAAGAGLKGKIYYAKIYSGDALVADMIPVKKSDGTLCLYDKVRKKYIYNAGTGTLTE